MDAHPLSNKAYSFALDAVKFCRSLIEEKREYILSKQLMRSATSIGANVQEARQAQSKRDFISKLSIALKEAHESLYWLQLIRDSEYANDDDVSTLISVLKEVIALLTASIKTAKKSIGVL